MRRIGAPQGLGEQRARGIWPRHWNSVIQTLNRGADPGHKSHEKRSPPLSQESAPILIIGGGASGLLVAVNLLQQDKNLRVVLVERLSKGPGAGVAYGTEHLGHLLNVPAGRMGAFPDRADDFLNWLREKGPVHPAGRDWAATDFAPRRIYRDYLRSLIVPFGPEGDGRLEMVAGEVADLVMTGNGFVAQLGAGQQIHARAAVLASGNEGPTGSGDGRILSGWDDSAVGQIDRDAEVGMIGTGLTMIDNVITLLDNNHRGRITALSRRGLLPQPHVPGVQAQPIDQKDVPFGARMPQLTGWLRQRIHEAEADGVDWRAVVDGLRPHTQALWMSLADDEKRRFLRHGRAWWDVARHRMAPEIAERIKDARIRGQLAIGRARILGIEPKADGGAEIRFRRPGAQAEDRLRCDVAIECRGRSGNIDQSRNPLIRRLAQRGVIRPDRLHLGVDVDEHGAVIDREGQSVEGLLAVGPLTIGRLWEIIAVPDIRQQAADLAAHLIAHIRR